MTPRALVRLGALGLAAAASACAPAAEPARAQWRVSLSTDAPLPQFGERLRIDLLAEDGRLACDGCTREVGLGATTTFPVSFGVEPPASGARLALRARLFRARIAGADGAPAGAALIDAVAWLPPPLAEGVTDVALDLRMACFGVPPDLAAHTTCDPAASAPAEQPTLAPGATASARPGEWSRDAPCPASSATPDAMACIPGGAFLLGDAAASFSASLPSYPERLVSVSAFYLDLDEVTVGAVRSLLVSGALGVTPVQKRPTGTPGDACTFLGVGDASADAMPANCIPRSVARDVCATRGLRLPTEAEWEFAAGNGTAESTYPWGNEGSERDVCQRARVGHGPLVAESFTTATESIACRKDASGSVVEPSGLAAGGGVGDVTRAGAVRNLAGSVSEWTEDAFAPYDAPCWQEGPHVLGDPTCGDTGATSVTTRGGAYDSPPYQARAAARNSLERDTATVPGVGFRCAGPVAAP